MGTRVVRAGAAGVENERENEREEQRKNEQRQEQQDRQERQERLDAGHSESSWSCGSNNGNSKTEGKL